MQRENALHTYEGINQGSKGENGISIPTDEIRKYMPLGGHNLKNQKMGFKVINL